MFVDTGLGVWFVVCAVAIQATVFVLCWCGMVSDVSQTQRRGSWIPGKERAEKVLATAVSIDGRKEWSCKFCSESNVWTRWRCRRCYHVIPAVLRGKKRQAAAARNGEWSTGSSTSSGEEDRRNKSLAAENKELRARLEALEKKEGEGVQGGQGLPSRREGGLEELWSVEMDLEDEAESRKKLDEQKRKLQKEMRDIEKFSCVPKEFQENLKSNLQQQLQEVEQRWNDLMPEHRKVQKKNAKFSQQPGQKKKVAERQYHSR